MTFITGSFVHRNNVHSSDKFAIMNKARRLKYNKEVALEVIGYVTAFLSWNLLLCLHIDKKSLGLFKEDNCGL